MGVGPVSRERSYRRQTVGESAFRWTLASIAHALASVATVLKRCLVVAACFVSLTSVAAAQSWTLTNPTGKIYEDEVVRLKINLPRSARQGDYIVKADGKEVAGQIGEYDGRNWMYVVTSLAENQAIEYSVSRGRPKSGRSLVSVKKLGDAYELSNDRFAVKLPASVGGGGIPSPILAVRGTSGRWVGSGFWQTGRTLDGFSAEVLGEGPIFAKVRLHYKFDGNAGLYENTPAFATIDVTLLPGQQHAVVEESHEMDRGDYWEFDCASGWNARRAICVTHGKMPAHGGRAIPAPTSLRVGQTRMGDTLVNLQPRWTQDLTRAGCSSVTTTATPWARYPAGPPGGIGRTTI